MNNVASKIVSMIEKLDGQYSEKITTMHQELLKVFEIEELRTIYESECFIDDIYKARDSELDSGGGFYEKTLYKSLSDFYNTNSMTPSVTVTDYFLDIGHYLLSGTVCMILPSTKIEKLNHNFFASKELLLNNTSLVLTSIKYIVNFSEIIDLDIMRAVKMEIIDRKMQDSVENYTLAEEMVNSYFEKRRLDSQICGSIEHKTLKI